MSEQLNQITPQHKQPNKNNIFNIFSQFTNFINQNKPKLKSSTISQNEDDELSNSKSSISISREMPSVVRIASRGGVVIEPLKIECEAEAEKSTTPAVLWQVYALGGILMLRWVWARWNERRAGKGSSGSRNGSDPADASHD